MSNNLQALRNGHMTWRLFEIFSSWLHPAYDKLRSVKQWRFAPNFPDLLSLLWCKIVSGDLHLLPWRWVLLWNACKGCSKSEIRFLEQKRLPCLIEYQEGSVLAWHWMQRGQALPFEGRSVFCGRAPVLSLPCKHLILRRDWKQLGLGAFEFQS